MGLETWILEVSGWQSSTLMNFKEKSLLKFLFLIASDWCATGTQAPPLETLEPRCRKNQVQVSGQRPKKSEERVVKYKSAHRTVASKQVPGCSVVKCSAITGPLRISAA